MAIASYYYYRRVLGRAWQDTKAFFGWKRKTLIFLPLYAAGLCLYWLWQGREAVKEEIVVFLAFGLAPMGAIAVLLFIWNAISAPMRIEKDVKCERKKEVDKLNIELQESKQRLQWLEEERIPRIIAKPYSGRRQWEHEHEHLMWAELQVTNLSPSQGLNDVEVRVVSCVHIVEHQDTPDNYMLVDLLGWSPTGVYWSERDAPPHQLKCAIPPNSTRNALVAYQNNSNGITTIFNSPISPNPIIVVGARIEIEVSSPDSALWEGAFYIQCHPNYVGGARATFEFVEWETWANSRNEIHPLATDKGDSETE